MESKECVVCGKKIKIISMHKLNFKMQKYCSKKCASQAIVNERYSLLEHVKFFRSTHMVYTDWAVVPKEWYPKGIRRKAQGVKWTQQEIKEFREWNQKNA